MTFQMMLSLTLLSMLIILLPTKCDQTSDLWQQLELSSELESDLWDTGLGGGSGLLILVLDNFTGLV